MNPSDSDLDLQQLEQPLAADLRRRSPASRDVMARVWAAVEARRAGESVSPLGKGVGASWLGRGTLRRATIFVTVACLTVALGLRFIRSERSNIPQTVTTAAGQRITLQVGRHMRVTLAPRTTVSIKGHDVMLEGEAFFDITHHEVQPVVVHTGAIATRVLGTQFDVRRYATDASTRVIVTEGRVHSGVGPGVTLVAGQMVYVTDSTIAITVVNNPDMYTGWTHGRLAFANIPVCELLETLGHWYGLQFRLMDTTLAAEPVSVRFEGQSVTEVLKAIETILDVTITVDGRVVTLHARAQSRGAPARRALRDSLFPKIQEAGR